MVGAGTDHDVVVLLDILLASAGVLRVTVDYLPRRRFWSSVSEATSGNGTSPLNAVELMSSAIISYLAIYIGFVLVIACAAILAIQQLSSVSDAISSYRLLADLGCPRSMATRSLLAQTLAFFLLPLVVALAHTSVALYQLIRVVSLFGSSSWTNAIVTTTIAFVAVYGTYFVITFLTARGIVTTHTSRARE